LISANSNNVPDAHREVAPIFPACSAVNWLQSGKTAWLKVVELKQEIQIEPEHRSKEI